MPGPKIVLTTPPGFINAVDGDFATWGNMGNAVGDITATFPFLAAVPRYIHRIGIKWGDFNGGAQIATEGKGLEIHFTPPGGGVLIPLLASLMPPGDLAYHEVDIPPVNCESIVLVKKYNVQPIDVSVFEIVAYTGPPIFGGMTKLVANAPVNTLSGI